MVYTKRQVETEKDRFGGYASPVSRYSLTEEDNDASYDNTSTYNPYASAYHFDTDTDVEDEVDTTTESNEPQFEYEREYVTNNNYKTYDDEEENPFQVRNFERLEIEKRQAKRVSYRFNTHGKILLTVYSAICIILVAFAIFNAVQIGKLATANSATSEIITAKQEVINVLEDEYNYLGSDEGVSSRLSTDNYFKNFVQADDNNTVTLYLGDFEEVPTYTAPSNWFDKVCEFFSGLLNK